MCPSTHATADHTHCVGNVGILPLAESEKEDADDEEEAEEEEADEDEEGSDDRDRSPPRRNAPVNAVKKPIPPAKSAMTTKPSSDPDDSATGMEVHY